MNQPAYHATICPVTKTIELISGKWKPIILYLIQHDVNRFGLLKRHLPNISKKVLTEHLRDMEKDKLISREVFTTSAPHVVVYSLTESGQSLRRVIDEIFDWGVAHLLNIVPEVLQAKRVGIQKIKNIL